MTDFRPKYKIARFGMHNYEEPPISGTNGSGTVFFSGCALKCVFCQNYEISKLNKGIIIDENQLCDIFLQLQSLGAHNINLVTPSHYIKCLASTLLKIKPQLNIPIVYNTSSYESKEDLQRLDGLVDIYLPDFKYYSEQLANKYSQIKNYYNVALSAITEMLRQQPKNVFDKNNIMQRGVIVRHLVLPNGLEDTKMILDTLSNLDKNITVSLMGQYFPPQNNLFYPLNRRLTRHEYQSACDYLLNVGLKNGYFQELSSATVDYVPNFDLDLLQSQLDKLPKRFNY